MANEQIDPRWPKLLSLAVHEFRTPITVIVGYLRMVLKERVGPISDQQRKLLQETEKSCGQLSELVTEMSELSALEGGKATFNSGTLDLTEVLREAINGLPEMADRSVSVVLEGADGAVNTTGDSNRLRGAFTALLSALRREVVTSDRLVVRMDRDYGAALCGIFIGEPENLDAITKADVRSLERFDEWRGGSGLSLAIARRVFGQHGGTLLGPPGGEKAGAVLLLSRQ